MKNLILTLDTPCLETMIDEESGLVARRVILNKDHANPIWVVYDRANIVGDVISKYLIMWTHKSVKAYFRQFNQRRYEQKS